jgi:RTX calcium-binding nonapeptide repeat (4 copies)
MSRIADGGLGAWATIIRNESDEATTDICDGYEYCAFGAVKLDATTEEHFYCKWDGDDYDTITLVGTSFHDKLFFHHTQNSEFDLQEHSGVGNVDGEILGLSADDDVHGSRHVSGDYQDWLYGGPGGDTIWGHEDADRLFSGAGDDTIWAGPGNDVINLEGGNNEVSGEDGDDTVQGGPGRDFVHGGDGADVLYGHEGDDAICGGEGVDTLDGGAHTDVLYAGVSSESQDGGPGTDECQGWPSGPVNCEGDLSATPPDDCPPEHET